MMDLQLSMPQGSLGFGQYETHGMEELRDAENLLKKALMVRVVLLKDGLYIASRSVSYSPRSLSISSRETEAVGERCGCGL